MTSPLHKVLMEEDTDPGSLAEARVQREQVDRNSAWLQSHASEVFRQHRGKCICIAGERLFVADTAAAALAQATATHPQYQGRFVHYIPKEKESAPRLCELMVNGWSATMGSYCPLFVGRFHQS